MGENYVGDQEVGCLSAVGSQQQMSHSFSWSVRNVAILASACVVVLLSFGALYMVASFYPLEVSLIIGEQLYVKHIYLAFLTGYVPRPVARIFYGWVRSVDYTDQRAPEALFTRGVRGHAPPGNFEN